MATATRSKASLWLLGTEETEITGTKLPSKKQVLCVFAYHHTTLKEPSMKVPPLLLEILFEKWKKTEEKRQPTKRDSEDQRSSFHISAWISF